MRPTHALCSWLLEGDPAIRWQTMRGLQGIPASEWQTERERTLVEGWGARLLELQEPDGTWGGGLYLPKWTSTTYTLLTLCAIGIPSHHAPARRAAEVVLEGLLGRTDNEAFRRRLAACDRCVVGMCLSIAAYFGIGDKTVDAVVENLLAEAMPDGGWNCRRSRRPETRHSSLHTTFNVLDGLRGWLENTPKHPLRRDVLAAEGRALEFTLRHRLFRSDRTGQVINQSFTLLSYPHRWHYNVLRGLVHFARVGAPRDERLEDAINLLNSRRRTDGTWPLQRRYPGKVYFEMEKVGGPSRWNTLRALLVLQWGDETALHAP